MRRGRGVRVGVLRQLPVLPAGTVRRGRRLARRGRAKRCSIGSGMGGSLDTPTDRAVGRAGEAGGARRAARARARRCSSSTSRPTTSTSTRSRYLEDWLAAFPGGLAARHPRPPRARSRHDQGARARPWRDLPPRPARATPARATPRTSRRARARRAGRDGRADPARTWRDASWPGCDAARRRGRRKPKARIAAANAIVDGPAAGRGSERRARPRSSGRARLGSKAIELHGVGFSWPGRERAGCCDPFDHLLEPGDRLGVVGPNGAGKTTLLDLIAGRLQPTVGRVERGTTVQDRLLRPARPRPRPVAAGARRRRRPTRRSRRSRTSRLMRRSGSTATPSSRRSPR